MAIQDLTRTEDVALTVDTDAYTAGDVVGGLITVPMHSAGGGGRITDIYLTDAANQSEPYTIYIFRQKPTVIADDAAWPGTLAIGDLDKLIRKVSLAAAHYTAINSLGWAHIPDLEINFQITDGNLYFYLVAVETPDYAAAGDVKLHVTALLN